MRYVLPDFASVTASIGSSLMPRSSWAHMVRPSTVTSAAGPVFSTGGLAVSFGSAGLTSGSADLGFVVSGFTGSGLVSTTFGFTGSGLTGSTLVSVSFGFTGSTLVSVLGCSLVAGS